MRTISPRSAQFGREFLRGLRQRGPTERAPHPQVRVGEYLSEHGEEQGSTAECGSDHNFAGRGLLLGNYGGRREKIEG